MRRSLFVMAVLFVSACGGAGSPDPATAQPDEPQTMNFDDESLTSTSTDQAPPPAPASPIDSADAPTWAPWVRGTMLSHASAFAHCYASVLAGAPDTQGRVVVHYLVHPDGTVGDASIASTTFPAENPTFDACVLDAMRAITFPASTVPTSIYFPLDFRLPDDAPAPSATTPPPS